jgi:hypothetical protein
MSYFSFCCFFPANLRIICQTFRIRGFVFFVLSFRYQLEDKWRTEVLRYMYVRAGPVLEPAEGDIKRVRM